MRACSSGVRIEADFVREMSFGPEYQAIGSDAVPVRVCSNVYSGIFIEDDKRVAADPLAGATGYFHPGRDTKYSCSG